MAKPQYKQKFCQACLKDPPLQNRLIRVKRSTEILGKCKVCNRIISNRRSNRISNEDLKNHRSSKIHQKNELLKIKSKPKPQPKILPFQRDADLFMSKQAKARLSLFIAQHTSNISDHLINACKKCFDGKAVENLHVDRTKYSGVIKNIIEPFFFEDLKTDVGDSKYSLIIDESTTVNKYLGIIIIYFSNKHNKFVTSYLDIVPITKCNAKGLITAIKRALTKYNFDIKNLMGIGTDNASVMVGINKKLYVKLKKEVPNLILIPCICHSLQLAVSYSARQYLPRNIEFIIHETYNWFNKSAYRQDTYKRIYNLLNYGLDPLKIVQACQTRWLFICSAVSRICEQWLELKRHFNIVKLNDKCYTAKLLSDMYNDDIMFAYLSFLKPILDDVQRINKLFETNNIDPTILLKNLLSLIKSLVKKVTKPDTQIDIFKINFTNLIDKNGCYLGQMFEKTLRKIKKNNNNFTTNDEAMLRERCINFIINLIEQLKARLPENVNILKKMSLLSVDQTLKRNERKLTELLEYFRKSDDLISRIETQYENVSLFKWNNCTNTREFWCEVKNFKNNANENQFLELADFAMEVLTLPLSNAEVECLFSSMNTAINKLRNRIQVPMLSAILTIRAGLKRYNKCCDSFDLPISVINKIESMETGNISSDNMADEIDISYIS